MHVSGLNRRYRLIDKQKNEVTIKRTAQSITINEMDNRKNKAAKKRTAQSITISEVDNRVPFSDGNHLIRRDTPGQDTQLRGRHAFTFYVHYFLLGKLKFDNNIPVQICTTVVQNTVYLLRFHWIPTLEIDLLSLKRLDFISRLEKHLYVYIQDITLWRRHLAHYVSSLDGSSGVRNVWKMRKQRKHAKFDAMWEDHSIEDWLRNYRILLPNGEFSCLQKPHGHHN
jgi:hypothetical protein